MAIPDWVARETRYLDPMCCVVALAMFTDGDCRHNDAGEPFYVLREEWPLEVGIFKRTDQAKAVWRKLMVRELVTYQAEDHIAMSGWKKGSYAIPFHDPIHKIQHVSNKDCQNLATFPLTSPLPEPEFESSLARARAITTDARAISPPPPPPTPPPPSPPTPPAPGSIPSLEEALEICGVDNPGDQVTKWGWNSVAVALRELVSALRRAQLGKQAPIESRAKYLMYQLRMGHGKRFEEVTDFSFLAHFSRCALPDDERVSVFPTARWED